MEDNIQKISDYIVGQVQEKSIETGFQYVVSKTDIRRELSIELSEEELRAVTEHLMSREEVADVIEENDGFDVVLYTKFAPNYEPSDYETEE